MTDIKWNNGKVVFGEDGFEVNSGDVNSPEEYGGRTHDETDALKTIGAGSQKTIHLDPTILADEGYIDLPAETSGRGFILIGDAEYWVDFEWDQYNAVQLIDGTGSTNPYNADEDDKFCIFDNSGDSDTVRIKNRLGVAKRIMFDATYTEEPLAPTFQAFAEPSGVDNLDPSLTINGTTVTPTFRYKLGDADGTDLNYWTYGEDLDLEAGTVPTYNDGSPGLGPNDDSALFNAGGYYQASGSTFAEITTEDFVVELVYKHSATTTLRLLSKRDGASPFEGYLIYINGTAITILIDDGATYANVNSATLNPDTWYHAMMFMDRSGSGQIYINGVASGSPAVLSGSTASLANTDSMTIGARSNAGARSTLTYDSNIAYAAMWKSASWLDTHLQATVAKERFAKLCGYYPEIAHNSANLLVDGDMEAVGTADWSALDATLSKDTTAPLYEGAQHLRITSTGNTFYARQTILTSDATYRITGAARSVSGSAIPNIYEGTPILIWTGTTSTDWQEFDFTFIATGTALLIGSASNHPGVVDFDDVTVTQINYMPTTSTRAFNAYIDKMEGDYRKLYYVGSEWLRMCRRWDSLEEKVEGYLPETAATNLIVESEDFLTTWTLRDAGDVVLNDQVICPDGRTKAASIAADSTDGNHGIKIDATLTADTYAFSFFVKPGSDATYGKDWCVLWNTEVSKYYFFDIANGVVGTGTSGSEGYIEGPFYSGDSTPFYRVCLVFTGTATSHSLRIYPANADTDSGVVGDASTPNIYVWGAQCELGDYMTSPIITDGGVASRLADSLVYVAGDNIGGEDVGQGTVVLDVLFSDYDKTSSAAYFYWIGDGTASADRVYGQPNASDNFLPGTRASGLDSGDPGAPAVDIVDGIKHSLRHTYEEDSTIGYVDGLAGTADTSCDIPDDVDTIYLARNNASLLQPNSLIQNFRIYGVPTTKG